MRLPDLPRRYNGHTLDELEEACMQCEETESEGLDSLYGDESESPRIVLSLIARIRELGGIE